MVRTIVLLVAVFLADAVFAEAIADATENTGAPKPAADASFSVQKILEEIPQRRTERLAGLPTLPAVPATTFAGNNPIDAFISAKWSKDTAVTVCDDATFARRVFLDVIGVIPTADEARAFVNDASPDKRAKLIASLLARSDDYAAHWVPFWEEALAGTPAGGNGLAARNIYSAWLFDNFKQNKAYDRMVAELLLGDFDKSAGAKKKEEVGENDPRAKEQRDAAMAKGGALPKGYIRNKTHADTMQTAANVGQVFLGTAIKCATCHNHFDNPEWKLETVTSFASLFAAKDLELVRCENRKNVFAPAKFLFSNADALPAGSDLSARVTHATRALVDPQNPRFARAFVNRLWKRYLGLGLVEPIDDFRTDRKASHPELLDWLAQDFLRNGCDVKHTLALILNSRTYQLSFNETLRDPYDSAKPDAPRLFRSPPLRRLNAEQVIDSARLAGQQKLDLAQRVYRMKDSTALTRALSRPPYVSAVSTARSGDIAILQMLELMNGPELHGLTYKAEALKNLAKLSSDAERADALYWSTLSRTPSAAERANALSFVKDGGAWSDLFWALLTSPEFHYQH